MKLHVKIITLDEIEYEDDVDLLNINLQTGNATILANHIPIISSLDISSFYIKKNGKKQFFAISGGMIFVDEKECKIIADSCELAEEIDIERAKQAFKRANDIINSKDKKFDMVRAEIALRKSINRINLYEHLHH